MKTLLVAILILILPCAIIFGQQDHRNQDRITVFVIDLSSSDGFVNEVHQSNDSTHSEIKQFVWQIDNYAPFKIELKDNTKDSTYLKSILSIEQSPKSINNHYLSLDDFSKTYSTVIRELRNNESLIFQITLDSVPSSKNEGESVKKIFDIQITPNIGKPNDCFLILSAIKSISKVKPTSEFFDLHAKFNYSNNWFSMLSMDFSTIESNEDSTGILLEGMLNINRYLGEGSLDKNRRFFIGAGMKIFDANSLYGVHFGSLEINGPFYSSYVLMGYYGSLYKEPGDNRIRGYHNMYIELAFTVQSELVSILSNLRIKLGYMQPLKNNIFDYNARLVIEIPIGGIIRFR